MKQKRIKYELRKGKVGRFDLYIFPGYQSGDMTFPAFCVLLHVNKRLKNSIIAQGAFTAVMN